MEDIAGWIAPIATMLAAMMTAANLGPRVTGWGFVVFAVGSVAWVMVAFATGQSNLLWTNAFLTLVNIAGIWRWLGRQARFQTGAERATERSARAASPDLFSVVALAGRPLVDRSGRKIARCIDGMAQSATGRISYLVFAEGAVASVTERLHAIDWRDVTVHDDGISVEADAKMIEALPEIPTDRWPMQGSRIEV